MVNVYLEERHRILQVVDDACRLIVICISATMGLLSHACMAMTHIVDVQTRHRRAWGAHQVYSPVIVGFTEPVRPFFLFHNFSSAVPRATARGALVVWLNARMERALLFCLEHATRVLSVRILSADYGDNMC